MPNKLSDLQIDEISLVYKGANQHSRVAIAKSLDGQQEDTVEIFDEAGNPVDFESLEEGDIVFDAEGNEYEYGYEDDDEYEEERELEQVGKSAGTVAVRAGSKLEHLPRFHQNWAKGSRIRGGAQRLKTEGEKFAMGAAKKAGQAYRSPLARGAAAGAAAGAGVVGADRARSHLKKSFGEEFRTELSKALSDDERDEVISKAFDYVEYLEEVAKSAEDVAKSEREARRYTEYLEIAKSYVLPVSDEELAEVFMAIEDALPPEQVEIVAKCFGAASEVIFDELGAEGGGSNYSPVMDAIEQYANTNVAKSDTSNAETVSKAFAEDPSLYDRYLSETGYYNR